MVNYKNIKQILDGFSDFSSLNIGKSHYFINPYIIKGVSKRSININTKQFQ
jgi:hypothetical protein